MATRSHVDPGVNERRLRPIYDCLDNTNYKKAIQEAEKLLKKQKDFQCAKALKALALIRLAKQDEGITILEEVHKYHPTDDPTLQAMTICYRELHKSNLIADAYENAIKKDPTNEETYSHLFMAYVRLGEYKKQQQTALALYKLKSKNPYYFWAVMSLVMQACNGDKNLAKNMFLPLAQKMVEKFVSENKINAEAEVQLYLMILENQGKYEECIEVLEGPLSEKLVKYLDSIPRKKAELLTKLKRWPQVNSAYKSLLIMNPDQWSYYLEYFKSIAELIAMDWKLDEETSKLEPLVDYNYQMAMNFVNSFIINKPQEELNKRGPFLAQLEVLHKLKENEEPIDDSIGSITDLLYSFFLKYGAKTSCCLDISHAVSTNKLTEQEISELLRTIKCSISLTGDDKYKFPENVQEMQRHLCYCQLCYGLGFYDKMEREEKIDSVLELIKHYQNGLQFGACLLPTDFQPSDNYCLVAANILCDIWQEDGSEHFLCQLFVGLEQALQTSPSNFHFKLLLMKLYNAVGATGPSHALWESVDMKHIQQETLGYLLTSALLSSGHYTTASAILGNSVCFFTGNFKDTAEYLIACYKFGSFTKIQEMVDFREKLSCSLQFSAVTLNRLFLDLMLETKSNESTDFIINFMEIDPDKDRTIWQDLVDNRDVSVFRILSHSKKGVIEQLKKQTFVEEVLWLKLRNLLVRSIAAAFYLSRELSDNNNHHHNDISNGENKTMSDTLAGLILSIREHIAEIDPKSLHQSTFPLQAPSGNRLHSYLEGGHCNIIISLLGLILQLYNSKDDDTNQCDNQIKSIVNECFQNIFKRIDNLMLKNTLCQMKVILEEIVNCLETLCLATVILHITHTILKPVKSAAAKKSRKKKEGGNTLRLATFEHFVELVDAVENNAFLLVTKIENLEISLMEMRLCKMSLNSKEVISEEKGSEILVLVKDKLHLSYQQSIKELSDLAQMKVKFLQKMKC